MSPWLLTFIIRVLDCNERLNLGTTYANKCLRERYKHCRMQWTRHWMIMMCDISLIYCRLWKYAWNLFDFARNFNFVLFTVWLCFLVSSTYFHEFQVSKARIEKVLIYLLDRLAGCKWQFAAASIQKMQDITKFLLNISENDNPVTLMLVTSETFPIPCEQHWAKALQTKNYLWALLFSIWDANGHNISLQYI